MYYIIHYLSITFACILRCTLLCCFVTERTSKQARQPGNEGLNLYLPKVRKTLPNCVYPGSTAWGTKNLSLWSNKPLWLEKSFPEARKTLVCGQKNPWVGWAARGQKNPWRSEKPFDAGSWGQKNPWRVFLASRKGFSDLGMQGQKNPPLRSKKHAVH